jgi:PAS domain S-box-containing protein
MAFMTSEDKVKILLVDDQPSKLLTYEVILRELGESLIKAASGKEALEQLLKNEIAVVLMDVCMPELDGFELASMIREHPRFRKIAMIFISAVHLTEIDHLRGYEMGAVDYVPVPVVPEVLRAKVRVFTELYRKGRQLERLNSELERRVAQRTVELETSTMRLMESERRRSLALLAGKMGSWDWDLTSAKLVWDEGQHAIYGVTPGEFAVTPENIKALTLPEDWEGLRIGMDLLLGQGMPHHGEYRIRRPDGKVRWCAGTAAATRDDSGRVVRVSGVTMDITERKQAEERQALLAREVDHRAKNAMAIVQSIVKLTKAKSVAEYAALIEGRIKALSRAHAMLSDSRWQGAELTRIIDEELAPYRSNDADKISLIGPKVLLDPTTAQTLALALHELATNAAKYGSLSEAQGHLELRWSIEVDALVIDWIERNGPPALPPLKAGFGTRIIRNSVVHQLEGEVIFDWGPQGLSCKLQVPRGHIADPDAHIVGGVADPPKILSARRIMIVEDEALVAMALEEQLQGLGISVVAVCSNVADALNLIESDPPDAAVLDVNLKGQLVYPVADRLIEVDVPFVFVTGYGRESVDRRYSAVPILEKPVDGKALQDIFVRLAPPQIVAA